jgi:hypothetical protein
VPPGAAGTVDGDAPPHRHSRIPAAVVSRRSCRADNRDTPTRPGVKAAPRGGIRKHLVIAATKSHRHRQAMPQLCLLGHASILLPRHYNA